MKEREKEAEALTFSPGHLAALIDLTESGSISMTTAKKVFEEIFDNDLDPRKYVEEHGLLMVSDDGALRQAVKGVLEANPKTVDEYRGGKTKVTAFLVGQVMKQMKGTANPGKVSEMILELLKE